MSDADAALLVVDDIEDNRFALTRRLARQGYLNVTTAADGRQAMELLNSKPFDLVLLDIMMPNLNGYEVLAEMKANSSLRHIPVIMISAVDELDSVIRCIELGAEDYLPKPFNPTLLRARVGACLERKRLHDQVQARTRELSESLEYQTATGDVLGIIGRSRFGLQRVFQTIVEPPVGCAGPARPPLQTRSRQIPRGCDQRHSGAVYRSRSRTQSAPAPARSSKNRARGENGLHHGRALGSDLQVDRGGASRTSALISVCRCCAEDR